jgi:hypothetical protein
MKHTNQFCAQNEGNYYIKGGGTYSVLLRVNHRNIVNHVILFKCGICSAMILTIVI